MPWVRIDENAIDHPKFLALSDGAWRLWVEGLAYCQKHLTDGRIPMSALRRFRYFSALKLKALLTPYEPAANALWLQADPSTVVVHDYLDWNDSREEVLAARRQASDRRQRYRDRRTSGDASSDADGTQRVTATVPSGVGCSGSVVPLRREDPPPRTSGAVLADARSKRPIFKGRRFVVFEWQLDDLRRLLGSHAEDFDLHAWFFELDAKADAAQIVVPQRDGGKWLQEQTLDEAARRGLPVATTAHTGHGKTAGNVAAAARFVARGQA